MIGSYADWIILGLILFVIILLVLAMCMEHTAIIEREKASRAIEHLTNVMYALHQAEIKTGVCCCGDNMQNHSSAYDCGHLPVDMFDYYGLPVLDAAQKFIDEVKSEE